MKNIKNHSGIYCIFNIVNQKKYIGSTINFYQRFREHIWALNNNRHSNIKLQRAWNKYGKINFKFYMVEFVNSKELLPREQFYMDCLDVVKNGYNIAPKAGNTLGVPCSEETKKKISKANKGKLVSEETKQKLKGKNLGNKFACNNRGTKRTEETKKKMSEAQKGNKKGIGNKSNTGNIINIEVRNKISNTLKGRTISKESIAKMKQTKKLNAINRKNTILLTHENQTMTLSQWAEKIDIAYKIIWRRYKKGLNTKDILQKG